MSSWMICNKCGHIFKTRRSRTAQPWKQRKQCHKCWSNDLIEFSQSFIIERYKELIIKSVMKSRKEEYKEAREILKRAAPTTPHEPVKKATGKVEELSYDYPQHKYPECFGDRNTYSKITRCFDCDYSDQCREKCRLKKK